MTTIYERDYLPRDDRTVFEATPMLYDLRIIPLKDLLKEQERGQIHASTKDFSIIAEMARRLRALDEYIRAEDFPMVRRDVLLALLDGGE